MSRSILSTLLSLTTLLFCVRGLCQKEVKIGFITQKKIWDESLKKKAFEEEIKKLLQEKKVERDAIREGIADLETAKALSGPEQAKKEEEKIHQKKVELLRFDKALQQEIEKKQAAFHKEILQDVEEAVREVAKEKGYTWVLLDEVLMCKDESTDLTFQTLVKINEKYIKSRAEAEEIASSGAKAVSVSVEDGLIEDVVKGGVRNRYTIKEIQPRKGSVSGSITMKGEGGQVGFVSQYPNLVRDRLQYLFPLRGFVGMTML